MNPVHDEKAFEALVEPHRKGLRAHCYRMTGSLHDADEVVQESLIKAWKNVGTLGADSNVRSWLYTVATRASLDLLDKRKVRSLPVIQGPALKPGVELVPSPEPIWLEPFPDDGIDSHSPEHAAQQKESIGLAFLATLQTLPPKQRAVLILREVLDFSAADCARMLDLTEAAVNSALQRARDTVGKREVQCTPPETAATRKLLSDYLSAWEQADVPRLVALLTSDAVLSMPPFSGWYRGPDDIQTVLSQMVLTPEAKGHLRLVPTRANAMFGFAGYRRDPATGVFVALGVHLLEFSDDGSRIAAITAFLDTSLFPRMGLAETLSKSDAD